MSTPEGWQAKLDRDFPQGAVCVWDEDEESPTYQVPRLQVVSLHGLDPVVALPLHGPEKVLGPFPVESYTVRQRKPVLEARVTLAGAQPMLWSAGVGPQLARAMSEDRERLLQSSPAGGPM